MRHEHVAFQFRHGFNRPRLPNLSTHRRVWSHEHVVKATRHKDVVVAETGFGRGRRGPRPLQLGSGEHCRLAHRVRLCPYAFAMWCFGIKNLIANCNAMDLPCTQTRRNIHTHTLTHAGMHKPNMLVSHYYRSHILL